MAGTGIHSPALKREVGLFGATALGIGAIIGSGIFIVTGIVAGIAGPAMVLSTIMGISRIVYSMARSHDLPRCLSQSIPGSAHRTSPSLSREQR